MALPPLTPSNEYRPVEFYESGDEDFSSRHIRETPVTRLKRMGKFLVSSLDFGINPTGQLIQSKSLTFMNTGFDFLYIESVNLAGDFSIIGEVPTRLEPEETFSVEVVFAPQRSGEHTGSIYLKAPATMGEMYVSLVGTLSE